MENKEVRSLFSQMREVYKVNSWSWEPFDIHLCGYDAANPVMNDAVSRSGKDPFGLDCCSFNGRFTERILEEILPISSPTFQMRQFSLERELGMFYARISPRKTSLSESRFSQCSDGILAR